MTNQEPFPFKRGDILENGWTTERNPLHLSVYLKCGKCGCQNTYDCIGYDGRIVHNCRDNNKLSVVGHMEEFDKFVKALKNLDKSKPYKGEQHD